MCTGGLPGPVLFGFAMDQSCLLWEKKCDGSTGACLYYDNHQMAWLLFAVCAACKVLNIVCGLLGWQLYMRKSRKGDVSETRREQQTGNNAESSTAQVLGTNNPAMEVETSDL